MRKNLLGLTAALFLTLCLTATAFAAGLKDGAYLVDVTMCVAFGLLSHNAVADLVDKEVQYAASTNAMVSSLFFQIVNYRSL